MAAIEFTVPGTTEPLPSDLQAARRVDALTREIGLLVYPCAGIVDGRSGDAVLLVPPLVVTESDANEIVDRLDNAIGRLCVELLPHVEGHGAKSSRRTQ
jgi:adenosylmethionine-8-amino-7-oxononanoate aminotransferase